MYLWRLRYQKFANCAVVEGEAGLYRSLDQFINSVNIYKMFIVCLDKWLQRGHAVCSCNRA